MYVFTTSCKKKKIKNDQTKQKTKKKEKGKETIEMVDDSLW